MSETINNNSNPYYKSSKIPGATFEVLLHQFCLNATVSDAAEQSGVSLRSVKSIFTKLRQRVADLQLDTQNRGVKTTNPAFNQSVSSVSWNLFDEGGTVVIHADWFQCVSHIHMKVVRGATDSLTFSCDVKKMDDCYHPSKEAMLVVVKTMQQICKKQGLRVTDHDGYISRQCWDHLVAATWLLNNKGRSYQSLRQLLLTLPL